MITFAGLAVSQPLSYQYRYSANVATGAIELSDQRSGVQLVADVHVSVSADKKKATFQVSCGTPFCILNSIFSVNLRFLNISCKKKILTVI